jgi:hypothetical protein
MGYWSDKHIEMQEIAEQEKKREWILGKLGDPEADEFTTGWYELEEEYDQMILSDKDRLEYEEYEEYEDYLSVFGKSAYDLFNEIIANSNELLDVKLSNRVLKNLLVMLFGHIVAATEAYLSSTFIQSVNNSEDVLRKLVETDPNFAQRKFSIKEIFEKKEALKDDVANYLKDIIFHEIHRVKPMYKDVLGINFGDVDWLFKAVILRHHCVHRAGYDKDGNEIEITTAIVKELAVNCKKLVDKIENEMIKLPKGEPPF